MKTIFFYILLFILSFQFPIIGQIKSLEMKGVLYTKQAQGGISISTNGFFLTGNYMWIRNIFYAEGIELDIGYKKHPKEQNTPGYSRLGYDIIFGKLNSLYYIRSGIGQRRLIIDKIDIGSIKINYYFSLGVTIGIVKPVYINVLESKDGRTSIQKRIFDYNKHALNNIHSGTSFITGFSESSISPGLYLKSGLSFDYSTELGYITSIDMGAVLDFFFNKIPLMEKEMITENAEKNLFIDFYISIHFGKKWF